MKYIVYVLLLFITSSSGRLNELYRWKQLQYDDLPQYVIQNIPSGTNLAEYANVTTYIPYNNFPLGVSQWKGKLFISVPRRNYGVPSTLNMIDMKSVPANEKSPKLIGYPSYELNALPTGLQPDSDRIISVYRTRVDVCDRLWILDTGRLEYPTGHIQLQRPAIWIFDLNTNERVRRYEIPESAAEPGHGFVSIQVDSDKSECNRAFAYIPNIKNYKLSVYSFEEDKLWTFGHNYFNLEPPNGDLFIQGFKFRWGYGIFSVALGPKNPDGYRTAYFHALASLSELVVSTQILQNSSLATDLYQGDEFTYLGNRGEQMQSCMHDIDIQSGIMIFTVIQKNSIGCWNLRTRFRPSFLDEIDQNDETMILPADLKVDEESNVWVLTNRMPLYLYGRLNEDDFNYRIFTNTVADAVKYTRCRYAGPKNA